MVSWEGEKLKKTPPTAVTHCDCKCKWRWRFLCSHRPKRCLYSIFIAKTHQLLQFPPLPTSSPPLDCNHHIDRNNKLRHRQPIPDPRSGNCLPQVTMSRRPASTARRLVGNGSFPFSGAFPSKTRSSPLLPITLVTLGAIFLIVYLYSGSGHKDVVSRIEGQFSATIEVLGTIPFLKRAYGDAMHKVLHVGPETCSVVSTLLKEDDTEAWGIEPYDIEDADASCKSLVRKGIVRVADIKFPLPYRSKSFSLVIVSDALDYLSPKYLNKTVPELARVAADGILIFTGQPGQQRARVTELSKFGRPAKMRSQSWWVRFFLQIGLEENETAAKKFDQAATKKGYKPSCQVFHLKSYS
ncbi:hypothetical protein V2J09_016393 [Rumex salicifolius]